MHQSLRKFNSPTQSARQRIHSFVRPRRQSELFQQPITGVAESGAANTKQGRVAGEILGNAQLSVQTWGLKDDPQHFANRRLMVEKLDVVEELERVLNEVFPAAAKYSTQVVKEFAPELPNLWMQRQHLGDIFSNILLNAREALFGQGEIRIKAEPDGTGALCITISDNGPGIPPERLNQIFQPYFTTKDKGSGLGLAIVKQNMSLYGGTVRVESEVGHGASFHLVFPTRALNKVTQ